MPATIIHSTFYYFISVCGYVSKLVSLLTYFHQLNIFCKDILIRDDLFSTSKKGFGWNISFSKKGLIKILLLVRKVLASKGKAHILNCLLKMCLCKGCLVINLLLFSIDRSILDCYSLIFFFFNSLVGIFEVFMIKIAHIKKR